MSRASVLGMAFSPIVHIGFLRRWHPRSWWPTPSVAGAIHVSDRHFVVQLNHFIPDFRIDSVAVSKVINTVMTLYSAAQCSSSRAGGSQPRAGQLSAHRSGALTIVIRTRCRCTSLQVAPPSDRHIKCTIVLCVLLLFSSMRLESHRGTTW